MERTAQSDVDTNNFNLLGELGWKGDIKAEEKSDKSGLPPITFLEDEYEHYVAKEAKSQPIEIQQPTTPKTRFQQAWSKSKFYVPMAMWMSEYQWKRDLPRDIITGFAIAAMIIPQGLAYSTLAGLPPIYGLYSAWIPLIVYFFLGTSRQLSLGPDALSSILLGLLLEEAAAVSTVDVILVAHFLAFLSGLFLFICGVLQFGFLDSILSRPLLSGFVNAVAFVILFEQVDTFFGLPRAPVHGWRKWLYLFNNTHRINWACFGIGVAGVAFLLGFRTLKRTFAPKRPWLRYIPEILILVIIGIAASAIFHFDQPPLRITILGPLNAQFPTPILPFVDSIDQAGDHVGSAVTVGIIGFVESIVVAKIYSSKHDYPVSPNRELVALGIANMIGSFFRIYPIFGSLPRSSVADMMGAQSQFFGVVASCIVLLTILFLGPVFYFLPKVIMSAIIIVAANGLIGLDDLAFLLKMKAWRDLGVLVATFLLTLFAGVELGIMAGMGLSVLVVIKNTAMAHTELLGNVPGTSKYKDVRKFPDASMDPTFLVIKVKDNLHFANIGKIKDKLLQIEKAAADDPEKKLKALIIHCEGVTAVDASAIQILCETVIQYHNRHIFVGFVKFPKVFYSPFIKSGLISPLQQEESIASNLMESDHHTLDPVIDVPPPDVKVHLFRTVHEAVVAAQKATVEVQPAPQAEKKFAYIDSGSALMMRTL